MVTGDVVSEQIRHIDFSVTDLTGDSGSVRFSRSVTVVTSSNLSCGPTLCTFTGASAPVGAQVDSTPGVLKIELLNDANVVVQTYTSP